MTTTSPFTDTYLTGAERTKHLYRTRDSNTLLGDNVRVGSYAEIHLQNSGRILDGVDICGVVRVVDNALMSGEARVERGAQLVLQGRAYITGAAHVQSGYVWLSDSCFAANNARLRGGDSNELYLYGVTKLGWNADVCDSRHALSFGPVGSDGRWVTVYRAYLGNEKWQALITAGCFTGTLDALERRINENLAWSYDEEDRAPWERDYRGVIAMGRDRETEWQEQGAPTEEDIAYWGEQSRLRLSVVHQ